MEFKLTEAGRNRLQEHHPQGTRAIPEECTLCGGSFEKDGKKHIFPYPPKHYLCFDCFKKSMDAGLARLNKRLASGDLELSVEEIADIIKPRARRGA